MNKVQRLSCLSITGVIKFVLRLKESGELKYDQKAMMGSNLVQRSNYLLPIMNLGRDFKTTIPSREEWMAVLL